MRAASRRRSKPPSRRWHRSLPHDDRMPESERAHHHAGSRMTAIDDPTRSRTVSWEDPTPVITASATLTGLELMPGIMNGELPAPPLAHLLGFALPPPDDR